MTFEHSKAIKKLAHKTFTNMLVATGEPHNIEMMQSAFPLYVENIQLALTRHDEKKAKMLIKALANNLRALNKNNNLRRDFLTQV